jgi:hypothetical protein
VSASGCVQPCLRGAGAAVVAFLALVTLAACSSPHAVTTASAQPPSPTPTATTHRVVFSDSDLHFTVRWDPGRVSEDDSGKGFGDRGVEHIVGVGVLHMREGLLLQLSGKRGWRPGRGAARIQLLAIRASRDVRKPGLAEFRHEARMKALLAGVKKNGTVQKASDPTSVNLGGLSGYRYVVQHRMSGSTVDSSTVYALFNGTYCYQIFLQLSPPPGPSRLVMALKAVIQSFEVTP